jgi:DNA-binding cell septation regulator SpoVG
MRPTRSGPGTLAGAAEAEGNITARRFSPNTEKELGAAHAAPWRDKPALLRCMVLRSFRPLLKGALRGFATIELPIGLVIHDIPVLLGKNGPWATLPAKPRLSHDGRQIRDANGKAAYAAVLDRQLATRFSDAVCALVRRAHPDALDHGGAP